MDIKRRKKLWGKNHSITEKGGEFALYGSLSFISSEFATLRKKIGVDIFYGDDCTLYLIHTVVVVIWLDQSESI